MLKIEYSINGRKVNNYNFADEFTKAILEQTKKKIMSRLSSVRCTIHNEYPKVLIKSESSKEIKISLSGCCDNLIEKAKNNLK